jgi:hypothetical protein
VVFTAHRPESFTGSIFLSPVLAQKNTKKNFSLSRQAVWHKLDNDELAGEGRGFLHSACSWRRGQAKQSFLNANLFPKNDASPANKQTLARALSPGKVLTTLTAASLKQATHPA